MCMLRSFPVRLVALLLSALAFAGCIREYGSACPFPSGEDACFAIKVLWPAAVPADEASGPSRHTRSILPDTLTEHTPGNSFENTVSTLRAMCFLADQDKYGTLEKQQVIRPGQADNEDREGQILLDSLSVGPKNLLVVANEGDLPLDDILKQGGKLADLHKLSVDLLPLNSSDAADGSALLPMYAAAGPLQITSGANDLTAGLSRSVAKIELLLSAPRLNDMEAVIPAGSQIVLSGALMKTALFDRNLEAQDLPTEGLYGTKQTAVSSDLYLNSDRKLVFYAYVGDYARADVSNMKLSLTWQIRNSSSHQVLQEKHCTISLAPNEGTTNNHIYRNVIYRIKGVISDFGNFQADVVDWADGEVIETILGFSDKDDSFVAFPWQDVNLDEILPGNDPESPWGNSVMIPKDWWDGTMNLPAGDQNIPGYGNVVGDPNDWGDNTTNSRPGDDPIPGYGDGISKPGDWGDGGTSSRPGEDPVPGYGDGVSKPNDWQDGNISIDPGNNEQSGDLTFNPGNWSDAGIDSSLGGVLDAESVVTKKTIKVIKVNK